MKTDRQELSRSYTIFWLCQCMPWKLPECFSTTNRMGCIPLYTFWYIKSGSVYSCLCKLCKNDFSALAENPRNFFQQIRNFFRNFLLYLPFGLYPCIPLYICFDTLSLDVRVPATISANSAKFWHFSISCLAYLHWYRVMLSDRNSFAEMPSGTALILHKGIKTAFYTKFMKSKYFRIFIIKILDIKSDTRKCIF